MVRPDAGVGGEAGTIADLGLWDRAAAIATVLIEGDGAAPDGVEDAEAVRCGPLGHEVVIVTGVVVGARCRRALGPAFEGAVGPGAAGINERDAIGKLCLAWRGAGGAAAVLVKPYGAAQIDIPLGVEGA